MSERESETREQAEDEDQRGRGGCADSDRSKGHDGDPREVEQAESPGDDWLDPPDAALAGDSTKTGKP